MSLGQRIKERRKQQNLSQHQLAEQSGVMQPTISRLEQEVAQTTDALLDIAFALQVSPYWLQTGEGTPDQAPKWLVGSLLKGYITNEMMESIIEDTTTASDTTMNAVALLSTILNESLQEHARPEAETPQTSNADTLMGDDWLVRLNNAVKAAGMTQEDLTEALGVTTRGAVGHYLSDRRQMSVPQFEALCAAIGYTPNQILGIDNYTMNHTPSPITDEHTSRLRHQYRQRIQHCDEALMQLRTENRSLKHQGAPDEERQRVVNDIRVLSTQRQCFLEAEADIALIEDELGI